MFKFMSNKSVCQKFAWSCKTWKSTQKVIYMYAFLHKIVQFLSQLRLGPTTHYTNKHGEIRINYLHGLMEMVLGGLQRRCYPLPPLGSVNNILL